MTPAHLSRLAERARSAAIDAAHWSMYANGRTQLNEEDREAGAVEYQRVMNQAAPEAMYYVTECPDSCSWPGNCPCFDQKKEEAA